MYKRFGSFIKYLIAEPTLNEDWKDGDDEKDKFHWSDWQRKCYEDLDGLLGELQVDVSEPISYISRIATSAFTKSLDVRRNKVLEKIKINNPRATSAIRRIAPSSTEMFGANQSKLEKVVGLNKNLSINKNYTIPEYKTSSSGGNGGDKVKNLNSLKDKHYGKDSSYSGSYSGSKQDNASYS